MKFLIDFYVTLSHISRFLKWDILLPFEKKKKKSPSFVISSYFKTKEKNLLVSHIEKKKLLLYGLTQVCLRIDRLNCLPFGLLSRLLSNVHKTKKKLKWSEFF